MRRRKSSGRFSEGLAGREVTEGAKGTKKTKGTEESTLVIAKASFIVLPFFERTS